MPFAGRGHKIKQVRKYVRSVLTANDKCDIEVGRRIGMAKDAIQKVSTVF